MKKNFLQHKLLEKLSIRKLYKGVVRKVKQGLGERPKGLGWRIIIVMAYTKQDCIESLREASERVSGKLSRDEYDETELSPHSTTIKNKFGSWDEAKEKAGLQLFDRQSPELEIPENREWSQEEWRNLHRTNRSREVVKSKLAEIKVSRGCKECGYDEHPLGLTFHHTDPSEKYETSAGDSRSMTQVPIDQIDEEVEKCIVLCSNCHLIEEHDDGRYNI